MEPQINQTPGTNIDSTALALSRAIRKAESGHLSEDKQYSYFGDNGQSFGAYQFNKDNFRNWATQYKLDPDDFSQTNQDHLAYEKIKDSLNRGLSQSEIAAQWNGAKVVNGKIQAINPDYVANVQRNYQAQTQGDSSNPSSTSLVDSQGYITKTAPIQEAPRVENAPGDGSLGEQLRGRLAQGGEALSSAATGKINPLSGLLQTVGASAGAVGDVTNSALKLIPGVSQAEDLLGVGVGKLVNTDIGKSVIGAGQSFAQAHPELAGDIGAIGNIATAIPILKGIGLAKNAIGGAVGKVLGKDVLASVIGDTAPIVGAKGAAQGAARGGLMQTLISGRVKQVASAEARQIAEAVVEAVPNFAKLGTFTAKLNATAEAAYEMAEVLKKQVIQSGKNILYPFKELRASLMGLEKPIMVARDSTLNGAYDDVINAALKIAQEKGGTISSLFDARKAFDEMIRMQFPNLYTSNSMRPMTAAIKNIRRAMNQFIEKKLPKGSGFSESLRRQSRLFEAVDNMASKAARETGTTRMSRFTKRHPLMTGLVKGAAKSAAIGATGGTGYEIARHYLGD